MIVWLGSVLFFAAYITVLIITHIKGGAYADELLKNTAAGILEATPSLVFETKHIREILKDHYADVSSMFWIGLPPVVTALLAAFLFHNRDWTRSQMYAGDVPNLNATLSCYLQPAGIIYAILFGFSYRVVSQRRRKFTQVLCEEAELLERMLRTVGSIDLVDNATKKEIFLICAEQSTQGLTEILGDSRVSAYDNTPEPATKLYSLFERMSENISVDTSDDGNRSRVSMWAVRLCLDMSQKLPKISTSRRQISNQGILVAEWSLMTMLAMAMYYGMILMNAESETMEITLCTITKLSSCFIMLAISDMNNLTRGIF